MPLSPSTAPRQLLHTRRITAEGYRRADGLYDIEGHLTDVKTVDLALAAELRPAGRPIHEMWLRITIDRRLTIVDAEARTDAMPYPGHCDSITPDYRKLVGMNLLPGFSLRVRETFAGTNGCTHITELIGSVATAAYQTLAGESIMPSDMKPFQLDKCHALKSDGPVAQKHYPRWFRAHDPAR